MKDNKIDEPIEESAWSKLVAQAKEAKKKAPDFLRREKTETRQAIQILVKLVRKEDVSENEINFLKAQGVDVSKALALLAAFVVIPSPILVGLTAFLEKKGVKILPIDNSEHLKEDMEPKRMKFNLDLPNDILVMNSLFKQAGYGLFVAGGAVRDAYKGVSPKDYDLATDAPPQKVIEIFNKAGGYSVIQAGNTFPVVHVATPDAVEGTEIGRYEIATFRTDDVGDSGDHRKPDTELSTIDQDAFRRDLTINALYYDIDSGEIIDYVGGIEDIENGIVRTVGDPTQRFDEHRIRVLRAIRFAARIGSKLDAATHESIMNNNSLGGEPMEAITTEFLKGIKQAKNPKDYIMMVNDYGLWSQVLPDLKVVSSGRNINERNAVILIATLLLDNSAKEISSKLSAAKYSGEMITAIAFLNNLYHNLSIETAVAMKKKQNSQRIPNEIIEVFAANNGMSSKLVDAFTKFKLSATGADASAAGIPKGPEMGKWIAQKEMENFRNLLS